MNAPVRFWIVAIVSAMLLAAPVGQASADSAASTGPGRPAAHIGCSVNVKTLGVLWDGMQAWAAREKDTGDALADAMKQTVGSSDPSDLEVLQMQKDGAKEFLAGVAEYRTGQMKDDLEEIILLGSRLRGTLPANHRSFVKGRITKIRSLYREYWYDAFASSYSSGYSALIAANLDGWYAATADLPQRAINAETDFQQVYRGLSKIC
ncbi:MAG: hypothetical protein WCP95_06875 [Actinomycetes bacterium]